MGKKRRRELNDRQRKLHSIIFEAETRYGRLFDVILMACILFSILVTNLESVPSIAEKYGHFLYFIEIVLTLFFTVEYGLRLYCSYKPVQYAKSFYGIIDLLAIIPTYLSLFIVGTQSLMVIRALRLLRVFRIFKMVGFMDQGRFITQALRASRDKIFIFIFFIFVMVNIMGSVMYLVEGTIENSDFDSIPRSIYWAIVTLTTVGYGDISPRTDFGQFLAAIVMILGYAVIAVPTGIVSSEMVKGSRTKEDVSTQVCMNCSKEGHDSDAVYCKYCSSNLNL